MAATAGGDAGRLAASGGWPGARLLTAPGPLLRLRLRTVERGEEVFERHPVIAILLTPTPIAGIHRVRAAVFLPSTRLGAVLWAVGIGLGALLRSARR